MAATMHRRAGHPRVLARRITLQVLIVSMVAALLAMAPSSEAGALGGTHATVELPAELGIAVNQSDRFAFGSRTSSNRVSLTGSALMAQSCSGPNSTLVTLDRNNEIFRSGVAAVRSGHAVHGGAATVGPDMPESDPGYRWVVSYCHTRVTTTTGGGESCSWQTVVTDYSTTPWATELQEVCTPIPVQTNTTVTNTHMPPVVDKLHPNADDWVKEAAEQALKAREDLPLNEVWWNSSPGYNSRQIIGLPTFLAASPVSLGVAQTEYDWATNFPVELKGWGGPGDEQEIEVDLFVEVPRSEWHFEEGLGTIGCKSAGRLWTDADYALIQGGEFGDDVCIVAWNETAVAEEVNGDDVDLVELESVQLIYPYEYEASDAARAILELIDKGDLEVGGYRTVTTPGGDSGVRFDKSEFGTEFNGGSRDLVVGEIQSYGVTVGSGLRPDQGAAASPWVKWTEDTCQKVGGWFVIGFLTGPLCELISGVISAHLAALNIAWDGLQLLGTVVQVIASGLWSLIKGCLGMVGDLFSDIKETGEQFLALASDPAGELAEISDTIGQIRAQLANPETRGDFVEKVLVDFGIELISLDIVMEPDGDGWKLKDDLTANDWIEWGGRMACEVIAAFFGKKIADALKGTKFAQRIQEWLDGRGIDIPTINIPDWVECTVRVAGYAKDAYEVAQGALPPSETNSFPGDTLVLMADGTLVPIQSIGVGDQVLSWDDRNGIWEPQSVYAQWSAVDDGQLATATLTDGSAITATDGHLFWVASSDAWVELEDVAAGDRLLTPTGAVAVASVAQAPAAPSVVWELSVTENHNFAVSTGTHNVLVHNACPGFGNNGGFKNPDGRPLFRQDDDGNVTYDSDQIGQEIDNVLIDQDGNPVIVKTDEFEIIYKTDGTVTVVDLGPPVVVRDGGIANPDGSVTVDNPDGSLTVIDDAGNSTTLPPNTETGDPGDVTNDPNYNDDLGGDDYDPSQDPLGPGCVASSFPTGTRVLMADGSHVAIDQIRVGDMVQAFSPETGVWSPRAVLDQWSYVDTDEMATITLADGSQVSATDHHLFWVSDERSWIAAEDLDGGSWLLTPAGQTRVQRLDIWPSHETLVWELTVDVDHTFTVAAGSHDLVVHNQDVQGVDPADLDANWQAHQANGGTAADWFDSLSVQQIEAIAQLDNVDGKQDIRLRRLKSGLRNGGGQHEFVPVSMAAQAKQLGLTAADIHSFTLSTNDFAGVHPDTGQVFNHKSSTASYDYHQALYAAIQETIDAGGTAQDALDKLNQVNQDWQVSVLPGAGDLYTENQLQKMIDNGTLTEAQAQVIRDNYLNAFDNEATPFTNDEDWADRTYEPPEGLSC